MPWFRLDDSFHSHPKVVSAGNEAAGLYVRCGAYAAQHLTDGFIPESIALLYGSDALAETLVRTKLWRRVRGGWRMPDYLDYNPSREAVDNLRQTRADAGRKGGTKSGETRRGSKSVDIVQEPVDNAGTGTSSSDDQQEHRSKPEANASGLLEPPSRSHPGVPVVDVVDRVNGSNARAPIAVIDAIIKEINDTTGTLIDPDWAQRIAADLLKPGVTNPAAYVRQCIRNDPSPAMRFLPHYGPPSGRHAKETP